MLVKSSRSVKRIFVEINQRRSRHQRDSTFFPLRGAFGGSFCGCNAIVLLVMLRFSEEVLLLTTMTNVDGVKFAGCIKRHLIEHYCVKFPSFGRENPNNKHPSIDSCSCLSSTPQRMVMVSWRDHCCADSVGAKLLSFKYNLQETFNGLFELSVGGEIPIFIMLRRTRRVTHTGTYKYQ